MNQRYNLPKGKNESLNPHTPRELDELVITNVTGIDIGVVVVFIELWESESHQALGLKPMLSGFISGVSATNVDDAIDAILIDGIQVQRKNEPPFIANLAGATPRT